MHLPSWLCSCWFHLFDHFLHSNINFSFILYKLCSNIILSFWFRKCISTPESYNSNRYKMKKVRVVTTHESCLLRGWNEKIHMWIWLRYSIIKVIKKRCGINLGPLILKTAEIKNIFDNNSVKEKKPLGLWG